MRSFKIIFFVILSLILTETTGSFLSAEAVKQDSKDAVFERNQERWNQLTGSEKEKIMRSYERWQSFSPEAQEKIKKRYEIFKFLPEETKIKIQKRALEQKGGKTGFERKPIQSKEKFKTERYEIKKGVRHAESQRRSDRELRPEKYESPRHLDKPSGNRRSDRPPRH